MKNLFFSTVKNFRYERKFYVEGLTREEIETILKFHPAIFREIYHKRTVNSIYFDSFNLQHYFDNINGVEKRLKVRIRWYGNLFGFIENPVLELKLKHNLHVGKLQYPVKPFTLDNDFSSDVMRKVFEESSFPPAIKLHLMELNFCLLNSYSRRYFLSSDRKYRITLDVDRQVYRLFPCQNNFLYKSTDSATVILEVKYNKIQDEFVDNITNHFPFRITRSSKYADGIAKLHMLV